MSDVAQMLDRTFLTIGGARVTLGGLPLLVLIAAATLVTVVCLVAVGVRTLTTGGADVAAVESQERAGSAGGDRAGLVSPSASPSSTASRPTSPSPSTTAKGAAGGAGVGGRRPVIVRQHIGERVTSGQRRTVLAIINQAVKLPHIGQTPIASAGTVSEPTTPISQIVAITQGLGPRSLAKAIGVLQPDQSSKIIGYCAISIIRKAWNRPGDTLF